MNIIISIAIGVGLCAMPISKSKVFQLVMDLIAGGIL